MKKNTNYAIIDHVGSLESTDIMKACYNLAYALSEKEKTYTMKRFCQLISRNPETRVSDKQKNFVRFNKHPEEVILICNELNTSAQWIADVWAEKTDKLTVIEGSTGDVYTMEDLHPEWFAERYILQDSIYRRCANIWGKALGWSFSAPLYSTPRSESIENYHRGKANIAALIQAESHINKYNNKKHVREELQKNFREHPERFQRNTTSKIASRPESYLKSKAVATEEECRQFFTHYKWLQQHHMLAESLEAGYTLCPHCGRPIYESAEDCDWCTYHREAPMNFTPYFDDSFNEEDWG